MAGISDLTQLIQNIDPKLQKGEFVFVSIQNPASIPSSDIIGSFREKEGTTLILERQKADEHQLTYDFIASWITLNIHSDLKAVGLTAAFSEVLAKKNISCNVVAGFYHDHIFVDHRDKNEALNALLNLKNSKV